MISKWRFSYWFRTRYWLSVWDDEMCWWSEDSHKWVDLTANGNLSSNRTMRKKKEAWKAFMDLENQGVCCTLSKMSVRFGKGWYWTDYHSTAEQKRRSSP